MMRLWMAGFWLATVVPMAALLAWMWPALAARGRESSRAARIGLAALGLLGAGFLLARPHDDSFTGLDNMTYRHLAHAFLEGRGFHDPDTVLAEVPPELRESFLLHRGPVGRPTRDRVFSLSGWQKVETKPFFMPTLPLAAAAQSPVLAPERFVPLVGALWWTLVLAAGFAAGGGWGLAAVVALALGTAWPAFFLRGFYAEGVGTMLIGAVVAAAAVRPLRGGMAALAGFALGMSVGYHPTMVVLAVPVGLALLLERRDGKTFAGVSAGMLAGFFPFWALTRWVCQPYGDWTRWEKLKRLIFLAPEHQAIALVVAVLAAASAVALWLGFRPAVRAWVRRTDGRMSPWGWLAVCAVPLALIAASPDWADGALGKGAAATWSGIRWPMAVLFLAGAGWVLAGRRPLRERFWLAALCAAALLFLFIQGVEAPVGLWSQRRFLPVVLMGVSLLAVALGAGLAGLSGRTWKGLALAGLILAGGANLARWPVAYGIVNETGAAEWVRETAEQMGPERWVVFDYYGHSVPYAADLKHRALGLGEPSRNHWPEVAEWIAGLTASQEVWVVSSWSPTAMEDGFRLEPMLSKTGYFPMVKTKGFFPAEAGAREVIHHFMLAVPMEEGETAIQDKVLDGSPVGLRGRWGRIRQGMTWTRQGSGIVGPVPKKGDRVVLEAECAWSPPDEDWNKQHLRVTPPWGGDPLKVEVPAGQHTVAVVMGRPADDGDSASTGVYAFRVERPFDPERFGLRGYDEDLGVQMRRIIIRIEPDGASVPD